MTGSYIDASRPNLTSLLASTTGNTTISATRRYTMKGNYYEEVVIRRFEYILRETNNIFNFNSVGLPLVIDVGGNIGFYSLLSAAWNHAALTFEINPANIVRICESLHLNSVNRYRFSEISHSKTMAVMVHQQGVSNTTGATFRVEVHRNPGQTALENTPQGEDSGNTSQYVFSTTTVTLDDFAQERGWFERKDLTVAILKIDTEGHEEQIILGAKRFLQAQVARNILLEYRFHCREAMSFLLDSGYMIVDDWGVEHGNVMKMYNKNESTIYLDRHTLRLQKSHVVGDYMDLWFRLGTLTLSS